MRDRQVKLLETKQHSLIDFEVNDEISYRELSAQIIFLEETLSIIVAANDHLAYLEEGDSSDRINILMDFEDKFCHLFAVLTIKLQGFLKTRSHANQSVSAGTPLTSHAFPSVRTSPSRSPFSTLACTTTSCPHCGSNHDIFNCMAFTNMSPVDRRESIIQNERCIKCLKPKKYFNHQCSYSNCLTCKKRHHSLLHYESAPKHSSPIQASENSSQAAVPLPPPLISPSHSAQVDTPLEATGKVACLLPEPHSATGHISLDDTGQAESSTAPSQVDNATAPSSAPPSPPSCDAPPFTPRVQSTQAQDSLADELTSSQGINKLISAPHAFAEKVTPVLLNDTIKLRPISYASAENVSQVSQNDTAKLPVLHTPSPADQTGREAASSAAKQITCQPPPLLAQTQPPSSVTQPPAETSEATASLPTPGPPLRSRTLVYAVRRFE